MHRLEHRRSAAGGVQVRRGGLADAAADRPAQVGEDVAEQVVGDDHVVAVGGVHEVDAGGVDVVVGGAEAGVLGGDLLERPVPEVTGVGHHVGLVHQRDVPAPLGGQLEAEADGALGTHAGVHRALRDDLVRGSLAQEAALARVGAFGVLPDDGHIDVPLGQPEGTQVHVQVQIETHPQQQAPLEHARGNVRCTDGAHVDGVEFPPFLQHAVGQDGAVAQVALAAEVVVHRLEAHACGLYDLQALVYDFGADAVAGEDAKCVRCHRDNLPGARGVVPVGRSTRGFCRLWW